MGIEKSPIPRSAGFPKESTPGVRTIVREQAWSADDLVLVSYFKEVPKVELLNLEEELALGKTITDGKTANEVLYGRTDLGEEGASLYRAVSEGQRAGEQLLLHNLRFVIFFARKYCGQGVPLPDLIQEGNLGLMRAVQRYDYKRGYRFSTYAAWWIRQAITRAIGEQGRTIRLPHQAYQDRGRLIGLAQEIIETTGCAPTDEELAVVADMGVEYVRSLLGPALQSVSLETLVGEEEDSELGQFIVDASFNDDGSTEEQGSRAHLSEFLKGCIEKLSPREQEVINYRFGFTVGSPLTLKETSEAMGITRERVRQIQTKAIRKLRQMTAYTLRAYAEGRKFGT